MACRDDALATAPGLAQATGLQAPTVSKILKTLAHSDLVTSHRGMHGGYTLSRPPAAISVAAIIEALEGPVALTACVEASDEQCNVASLCPIRGGWEKVNRAIRQALEKAEASAGTSVSSVWIGCAGAGLSSHIASVEIAIGGRRIEEDDIEHCTVIPEKDTCLEPGNVVNMKFTDAHVVSNEHSEVGYTINL